jgi:methionyl-tRNA formyltransferase
VNPRILFMGSPECAVPSLRAAAGVGEVVAAFTQPDRPCGRGRRCASPPVADAARELCVPVHQPEKIRTAAVRALLDELRPDVILVVAYGRILPPAILSVAPRGCVNVHFSLLPRHRGAAPVAHAILDGDVETGVTLMLLDEGMDTGPILAQRTVPLEPEETTGELTARLAVLGAELVRSELPRHLRGELAPHPQPTAGATIARLLEKADGAIRWDVPAAEADRRIRAVNPWPGAFGFVDGRRWIIHRARVLPHVASRGPGVLLCEGKRIAVGAADVCLELIELQREGCRKMPACSFLAGCTFVDGLVLRPTTAGEGG